LDLNNIIEYENKIKFQNSLKGKFYLIRGNMELNNVGKIYKIIFGYFFTFYCLYKIFFSIINLLFNRDLNKIDPINKMIQILSNFYFQIDISFIQQELSFLLIFIVIILSIRSLLQIIEFLLKRFFKQFEFNFTLLFSILMASYFISTSILIRINLPKRERNLLTEGFYLLFIF
jgi:golgi pH regulator